MNKLPSFHQDVLDRWIKERGDSLQIDSATLIALKDFIMWREPQVIPVKNMRRESFL